MKKNLVIMTIMLIAILGLMWGCTSEEASYEATTEEDTLPDVDPPEGYTAPAPELTSIQFDTLHLDIPFLQDSWEITRGPGSLLYGAFFSYDLILVAPDGMSRGTITIGDGGAPLTAEEFIEWQTNMADMMLPHVVEHELNYTPIWLNGGWGAYSIFTNAHWAGQTPPPGNFSYMCMFLGNWDYGFRAHATLLTNDLDNHYYTQLLHSLMYMEITMTDEEIFLSVERSFSIDDWLEIQETPVHDITGFNLLDLDLAGSALFDSHILESITDDVSVSVPVTVEGLQVRPHVANSNEVTWTDGGIGLFYNLLPMDICVTELLHISVPPDIVRLTTDGYFISTNHPIRASDDMQVAVFGMHLEELDEPYAVYIYIAQSVPGYEYMLHLRIVLLLEHWSDTNAATLSELSELIGLDLSVYWPWNPLW